MDSALIIEDHIDAQQWLTDSVKMAFPDIKIKIADTLGQAMTSLKETLPSLALVDLNLPDGSGLDIINHLAGLKSKPYIVVSTIYDDDHHIFPSLRAGADGYLLKDQSKEDLAESLAGIVNGNPPLSPSVSLKMMRYFSSPTNQVSLLTKKEKEVLGFIAKGNTIKQTSEQLFVSENTVSSHVKKIYRKFNISSRSEATRIAEKSGLLD